MAELGHAMTGTTAACSRVHLGKKASRANACTVQHHEHCREAKFNANVNARRKAHCINTTQKTACDSSLQSRLLPRRFVTIHINAVVLDPLPLIVRELFQRNSPIVRAADDSDTMQENRISMDFRRSGTHLHKRRTRLEQLTVRQNRLHRNIIAYNQTVFAILVPAVIWLATSKPINVQKIVVYWAKASRESCFCAATGSV